MGMRIFSIFAILLFSYRVFAGANGGGYVAPSAPPTTPTAGQSTHDAAKDSSSGQNKADMMNMISGGLMMTAAAAECSEQNYGMCAMHAAMGLMNFAQSSADGSASGFNSGIQNATDWGSSTDTGGAETADSNGGSTSSWGGGKGGYGDAGKYKDLLKTLADNNWKVDPNNHTIKSPGGKIIKPKDFSSASALSAAGVPKGMADDIMASAKKIEKEALAKANAAGAGAGGDAFDGEGGGGGGGGGTKVVVTEEGGGGAGSGGYGAGAGGAGGLLGGGSGRDPAAIAGMTKNFNGELIGVAGDSIFDMMNRRYKKKNDDGAFYDVSANPKVK